MNSLVGQKAPTLKLLDQDSNEYDLSTLIGHQAFVLFFFPSASVFSYGCNKEACGFKDALEGDDFKDLDVRVVGVTPSPVKEIKKMVQTHKVRLDVG